MIHDKAKNKKREEILLRREKPRKTEKQKLLLHYKKNRAFL